MNFSFKIAGFFLYLAAVSSAIFLFELGIAMTGLVRAGPDAPTIVLYTAAYMWINACFTIAFGLLGIVVDFIKGE